MNTLNKYLIKESLIPFLLSLGVITTVLFLQFLIRAVDRFLGKGLDVWIILEYLYLNLAWIIALSVPMSLLISTVMTYGRMSQDNEITALKAAGVSVFSIIKPAVLFGGLIGFLLCLFNNFVLPDMNYHARLLAKDIYQKKPELTIEPGYFINTIPQYSMIVREMNGNEFKDVKIFSKSDKSEQTTIYAEKGKLTSNQDIVILDLENGEMHEIDLDDYNHYRKIKFATHQITISIDDLLLNRSSDSIRTDREMKVAQMIEKIGKNKQYMVQINQRIKTVLDNHGIQWNKDMNLESVLMAIEILKENNEQIADEKIYRDDISIPEHEKKEKLRSFNNISRQLENEFMLISNYEKTNNKYLVEIHKKFTLAVACLLFAMTGAPLGILVRRGGITIASGLSIVFFLVYYILLIWGEQLADRNLLDPTFGSWMPNMILFIVGGILLFLSDKQN
ncbi:MAG: LptF/LptG family permease [Candidatus Neomarinimicrobiota bacterium]|nr:LptF/LptG family permease [Candidatus Neomarinimicrobiota bacterium]